MYRLLRPLVFLFLDAERAHRLGLWLLSLLGHVAPLARLLRARRVHHPSLRTRMCGLRLENPLGVAAGLDKDAVAVEGLFALGFGAVEVGTLTPRAQEGNPRPRLFRLPGARAVINRMGFNNRGIGPAVARLAALSTRSGPIGVNVGKNRETPLERAAVDVCHCLESAAEVADYFVVNASSPNTPGLRRLQEPEALRALLDDARACVDRLPRRAPLFLKIAPDLSDEAVDDIVDVAVACRIDGIIATNTTVERPVDGPHAAEEGGLSGAPLWVSSTRVLRRAYARAGGRLTFIGVGGVFSAEDVYEKIRAGASLVQVYTALVYEGPGWVTPVLDELARLLARDGFSEVSQAVGAAVHDGVAANGGSASRATGVR